MPIITVKIAPAHPVAELEPKLHEAIVAASSGILGKPAEITAVVIDRVDPRLWYAGGRTLAEQGKSSFYGYVGCAPTEIIDLWDFKNIDQALSS